jgi:hypothetical protein
MRVLLIFFLLFRIARTRKVRDLDYGADEEVSLL